MKAQIWFAWTGESLPPLEQREEQMRELIESCQRPKQAPSAILRPTLQAQMQLATTTAARQHLLIREAMRAAPQMRMRWEEVYRQYKDRWYGYLHHGFSLDPDVEAEIFSTLSVRVLPWKLIQEQILEQPIQWEGFLWTCAKREVLAWWKQNARECPQEPTELAQVEWAPTRPDPEENIEWSEQIQQLIEYVESKIETAPGEASREKWQRRRRVLKWLLLEEWNQNEIAHELGVRKGVISDDVSILREHLLLRQSQRIKREVAYDA